MHAIVYAYVHVHAYVDVYNTRKHQTVSSE